MTPEEMVSRLLYRDGLMLVVDKPAGLAVHPGPPSTDKGKECLQHHFGALRFGLPRPPALAHRLDRDTSGCLVLGRHRKALAQLGRLFKSGAVEKTYWAIVEGSPAEQHGTIALPLGRLDVTRGWWMKHDPEQGQPAVTKWKVLGRASGTNDHPKELTWLVLEPLTGRTHQLRVHCAEMGWPILGLQAREIVVPLYKNRPPVRVTAPVPAHMREALTACGWSGTENDIASAGADATVERGANTASP
jgi:tRNA pseudouridine32 synthase/23S rRNA pseudouridine746 synthase